MAGMDFSKLISQIDQVTAKKSYSDENKDEYWKPTKDKAGNAAAIIRFLPNKDIEDFPFVRVWSHSFHYMIGNTKRWYIENSLSTIGGTDYVGEVNQELWNTGLDSNKEICRLQKRQLKYVSNIYVVKDLGNPENNGKQFKFKYGQKIFEKIVGAAKPNEELGEEKINAFDVYAGADFLLKMQKVDDQFNYDASKFGPRKALLNGDDEKINAVLEACFDLNLEVAPAKFKTYEELKKKYLWVTGQASSSAPSGNAGSNSETSKEIDELENMLAGGDDAPKGEKPKATPKEKPEGKETPKKVEKKEEAPKASPKKTPPLPVSEDTDAGDDDAAFFASLAE